MEDLITTSGVQHSGLLAGRGYIGDDIHLGRVMAALERDDHRHLLAPSSEEDLSGLERAVRHPLPAQYRRFLTRLGGGIYYDRHEIFGAPRLMIHDIELVPAVLAVRARLADECGANDSPFLLPLHRAHGMCHWIDVRDGSVGTLGAARRFPGLAAFLAEVVLPDATPGIPA